MPERIVVLKFGSSVLRSHADLPSVVHEIYRWYRDGAIVIAVVSAIGGATEQSQVRVSVGARASFGSTGGAAAADTAAFIQRPRRQLLWRSCIPS